jgi:hypothetical protein
MPPTDPLRPINPDNAWSPRITAAAGTRLAAPYSSGTVVVLPREKYFTPRGASSYTRRRSFSLSAIEEYS